MKKYILFSILILGFIGAHAQNPVIINQPYDFRTWVKVKNALQFPTGCGVPSGTASLHGADRKMSAIYRDSCGKQTYVFEPSDSTWAIVGSGSADSTTFATNYRVDTAKINIRTQISTKLNSSDTANKWVNDIKRSNDSIYVFKNGVWSFKFKDSVGAGSIDTTSLKSIYLPLFLNNAKTINQAGHNITYTGGGKPIFDSTQHAVTYLNPVIGLDSVVINSNSIGVGANASVIPDSSYAGRLAKFSGLNLVNIAVSGTTAFQICKKSLEYTNPGHSSMQTFCAGFNDPRATVATTRMYNAIGNAYDAALINHCTETLIAAQDCTLYGSWTNFDAKVNAGGKTTRGAYSSTLNDSLVANITGRNIYIGLVGIHATAKLASIYIDGNLVEVVDPTDGGYTESGSGYQPMGKYYTGLSNTSHHIKIVVGTGSNFLLIDYIGSSSGTLKPFVFIDLPKMDATGYSGGNATEAITNRLNDTITARYNKAFAAGLNVYHAITNNYYIATTSSGLSSDHIHPNDLGHYQIFSSILTGLYSETASNGVLRFSNDGHMYVGKSGLLYQIPYTGELTLQKVISNSGYLPYSNYISGPGNLEFNAFTQIKLNKFKVSNSITASFDGLFQVKSSNGGLVVFNRDLDTTKSFSFYCTGNVFRITDGYNNTDIIKFDTSFRALFRNNKLGGLNSATATIHIEGNVTGAAGRASLKIDSGALMASPEKYAIEVNGNHIFWTDRTGTRFQIDQQSLPLDKQYTDANNTGTSETDLYTKTVAASTLSADGNTLVFDTWGTFNDATATANLQFYFGGTAFGGTGAIALTSITTWHAQGTVIRTGSGTARAYVVVHTNAGDYVSTATIGSLNFTTTNIIKITGTAGGGSGGSNDITGQSWIVRFEP